MEFTNHWVGKKEYYIEMACFNTETALFAAASDAWNKAFELADLLYMNKPRDLCEFYGFLSGNCFKYGQYKKYGCEGSINNCSHSRSERFNGE